MDSESTHFSIAVSGTPLLGGKIGETSIAYYRAIVHMGTGRVNIFLSHVVAVVSHMYPRAVSDVLFGMYGLESHLRALVYWLVLLSQTNV